MKRSQQLDIDLGAIEEILYQHTVMDDVVDRLIQTRQIFSRPLPVQLNERKDSCYLQPDAERLVIGGCLVSSLGCDNTNADGTGKTHSSIDQPQFAADSIWSCSQQKRGFRCLTRMILKFSFAKHLLYSLLCGRTVLIISSADGEM